MSQVLNIWWESDATGYGLNAHFDNPLHTRGTDFRLTRNEWDKLGEGIFAAADTPLLKSIARALFSPRSGVEWFDVTNYTLRIRGSMAVSDVYVSGLLATACLGNGFTDVYTVQHTRHNPRPSRWKRLKARASYVTRQYSQRET